MHQTTQSVEAFATKGNILNKFTEGGQAGPSCGDSLSGLVEIGAASSKDKDSTAHWAVAGRRLLLAGRGDRSSASVDVRVTLVVVF